MNLPGEEEAPEQPQVPQFPTDRVELNLHPIPQFPTDRVEKGESSDQIKSDE